MDNEKKLLRSRDKWIAGVCGGLANFFGFNRDTVRIVWLVLTLFSAGIPGVFGYLILWALMPKEEEVII